MKRVEVLDHGYVSLIEKWGSEEGIIEAARMSTARGFQGWGPKGLECPMTKNGVACGWKGEVSEALVLEGVTGTKYQVCPRCKDTGLRTLLGDEKLLRFLYENRHATPFEMAGMTIEVQAPIFVFREWHRHRTQSYNEMSARYTPLPDMNYVPTIERLLINSKANKQAGTVAGAEELDEVGAAAVQHAMRVGYDRAEEMYQAFLRGGVPKELARVVLPVGRYSRMRASTDLRNWLAFLTLRMDSKAQFEIRQYANAVGQFIEESFPRTWGLFKEGFHG